MTAIEFLNKEKPVIKLDISDYVDENDFYNYNKPNRGHEFLESLSIDRDFDGFYFEINLNLSFKFYSHHKSSTHEQLEEKELEFTDVNPSFIEITDCQKWNEEMEEYQEYRLSIEENQQIINYYEKNIN